MMRSVGFDSLAPSAGSMTRNDTRSGRCPARAAQKHRFLCISLPVAYSAKPTPVPTCRSPPGGGGLVRAAPFFSLAAALAAGGAVAPSWGDSVLRGADDPRLPPA